MDEQIVANPVIGDGEETPTVTPAEEQTDDNKPAPEGDNTPVEVPYHKDPRWMEMYEKSKKFDELQEHTQSLEEKLKELDTKVSSKSEPEKMPEWWKSIYGDNPDAWRMYSESSKAERESLKEEIRQEFAKEQETKAQELEQSKQYWQEWTAKQFEEIGITDEAEKNAVSKFVIDEDIRDANGLLDVKKGYKFYTQLNPKDNTNRKKVASMTSSNPAVEPDKKNFATAEDFSGKGWGDLP